MNFERVKLLLDIIHGTLNVPSTEKIRAEAVKELSEINAGPSQASAKVEPEPELTAGGRRL